MAPFYFALSLLSTQISFERFHTGIETRCTGSRKNLTAFELLIPTTIRSSLRPTTFRFFMKRILLCLALVLCLLKTDLLLAQDDAAQLNGIAAKVLFIDYNTPNSVDGFKVSNGLELAYLRGLNDRLSAGIPLKIGVANLPGAEEEKTTFVSLDFTGQYKFADWGSDFVPYGFAGVGAVFEGFEENNIQVPFGLGFYYKISENSFLTVQGEYRKSFENERDNIQLGLGWYFKLKPAPRPIGPPDADEDGIPDADDRCPDEAGNALAFGCPDTDEDGVPNGDDDCPTEKGSVANNGCPVPDDRDKDGVADEEDQCPDTPGILSLNGCPPNEPTTIDSDGDGVTNDRDECPDTPGSIPLLGCPDADGDGVSDKNDKCPTEPGLAKRNGCPPKDSDKDGILDEDDACLNTPGPAATDGCPDADGDGIGDGKDHCPNTPGFASAHGCPDIDRDGVPDRDDRCPNMPGDAEREGCPFIDSDGDGIADEDDECPNEKGDVDLLGCPDVDGDGIPDRVDKCPNEPGKAERNGCPKRDADNDGVEDADDLCPNTAGPATANGCPDSDEDTFGDIFDKCPDTPGTNQGCPDLKEEEKEFLVFAAKNIHFETGKATLKAQSYSTLDQVADILKKYPHYQIAIEGHTDNVGNNENNRILSEERAKSCHEYLLSRSVPAGRMSFKGYGESKPIASNSTEEGKLENRRVEFTLYLN